MTQNESSDPELKPDEPPFVLGWEEWLALPGLGLPAIKAKIDTGAKTSALHAFLIEPFQDGAQAMVRFGIHPIPGRDDIEIFGASPVIDRRDITSSNGDKETRFVIATPVRIAGRTWDIEIGLTNREGMAYRMLLGRQAIRDGMLVDPAASFRQPRLSHKRYRQTGSAALIAPPEPPQTARNGLRIAILTRQPNSASNRRLAERGRRRGHTVEVLDLARLTLSFAGAMPSVLLDGAPAGPFDALVPRVIGGTGAFAAAVIRALEAAGCVALNSGDTMDRLRDSLALAHGLAKAGAQVTRGPLSDADWSEKLTASRKAAPAISMLDGETAASEQSATTEEHETAERIAETLQLGLASVDFGADDEGRIVLRVSGCPRLGLYERVTGARVTDAIVGEIETRARIARVG
jgi:ribosomal protein S6--L-glutamate ligase